ncbi:hypothetical protein ANO11243_016470 [Dothideomycetidae sp. 11243]|nr:hypothetical protein ANO11243_016470 [fungal sp. No.11243]
MTLGRPAIDQPALNPPPAERPLTLPAPVANDRLPPGSLAPGRWVPGTPFILAFCRPAYSMHTCTLPSARRCVKEQNWSRIGAELPPNRASSQIMADVRRQAAGAGSRRTWSEPNPTSLGPKAQLPAPPFSASASRHSQYLCSHFAANADADADANLMWTPSFRAATELRRFSLRQAKKGTCRSCYRASSAICNPDADYRVYELAGLQHGQSCLRHAPTASTRDRNTWRRWYERMGSWSE